MSAARRRRRQDARLRYVQRCQKIGGGAPSALLRRVYVRFGKRVVKMWELR